MRTVTGMGETILDIIFQQQSPTAAIPGGSSFNSILSLARAGANVRFVGETGADEVGRYIVDFLKANRVDTTYFHVREDVKSAVSLAFLDENNDAHYQFYKQSPKPYAAFRMPDFTTDDVLLFGSYYAIAPAVRQQVEKVLQTAHRHGAVLYYDLNFRQSHQAELPQLSDSIHANFRLCDIVRGSTDDFEIMYGTRDAESIYRQHIAPYCPLFICTDGAHQITVCHPEWTARFAVPPVQSVSNIGAGDNFNAGFIYGLLRTGLSRHDLLHGDRGQWNTLIDYGTRFAADVCSSLYNCISREFGKQLQDEPLD